MGNLKRYIILIGNGLIPQASPSRTRSPEQARNGYGEGKPFNGRHVRPALAGLAGLAVRICLEKNAVTHNPGQRRRVAADRNRKR